MDERRIELMIEKFFDARLTAEEERELCTFLRGHELPERLKKDAEAVLALCGGEPDMEIPQGAEERLDALIDSLENDASILPAGEKEVEKERKRQLGIPRFVLQGAAAAAVVIAACIFAYDDASLHIEQTASLVAEHVEETEEDTFDNPEDAMKCFKAVVGDIKLALITTESNTREIGNTLNDAFMPYRDIIRINI